MSFQQRSRHSTSGDPIPPASAAGRSAAMTWAGGVALLFMVVAPLTYTLRLSGDDATSAEATLWINSERADVERAAGFEEGVPLPGDAWAALVRTDRVLDGLNFNEETTRQIDDNLSVFVDQSRNLLVLRLDWPDERGVAILDRLVEQYVDLASDLKQAKLNEAVDIADEAVWAVEAELRAATEEGSAERIQAGEAFHAAMLIRREEARMAADNWIPDVRVLEPAHALDR